ncbi:MAG: hypothetical protein Q7S09_00580 [bacterium]|nr:hypothetical protein [bacterium]
MNVITPSGTIFSDADIQILKLMAAYGFVRRSETPFKLKSGIFSHVYVSGREDFTDHSDLEWPIGEKIARKVWEYARPEDRQPCLIGIPTAGTALAQAAAMASFRMERRKTDLPINHRLMREVQKWYGAHQHSWVNGKPDLARHTYWMVDNVATDGQSKIEATEKLAQDGYPVNDMPCLIFIDRQQGAIAQLERAGFRRIVVVYNLLDITYALGEIDIWPKSMVSAVEEEIHAHQFSK